MCGDIQLKGASVHVGPSIYPALLKRLLVNAFDYRIRYFLGQRCDDAFLRLFAEEKPQILDMKPGIFMAYSSENRVLAKLQAAGLLPEEKRLALVEHIIDNTVTYQDGGVFRDDSLRTLLTDQEFADLLVRVRAEVLKGFDSHVSDWKSNCSDDDPDSHFDELTSFLDNVEMVLPDGDPDLAKIASGRRAISQAIDELNESRGPDADTRVETPVGKSPEMTSGISAIFEDVDL